MVYIIVKYSLTYHSEFLLIAGSALEREQRTVVSDLTLPLTVEVVCHDIDVILDSNYKFNIAKSKTAQTLMIGKNVRKR